MKQLIITSFSFLLLFTSYNLSAQNSCSYIIHVTGSGADFNGCGEEGTPCLTINQGITEAVSQGFNDVRVSNETYNEVVLLQPGINVWGGYDASWDVVGTTTLNGEYSASIDEYVAIVGNGATGGLVISDFVINAPNATTSGKSSYGIHLIGSDVIVQNCTVNGGSGANGAAGSNGVDGTGTALPGANGANGVSEEFSCSTVSAPGGAGGTGGAAMVAGGDGGEGGKSDTDCVGFPISHDGTATAGANGANAATYNFPTWGYLGASGGTCTNGSPGNDGTAFHGNGGTGAATANTLVANFWTATTGTTGSLGTHGTGGGGGGGGGGCNTNNETGGAGGGGGAGGLRAEVAGTGGTSGGNSAAVFASNSTIEILNSTINQGNGGNGGSGGIGGVGAPGALGGDGGTGFGSAGDGGDGGNGSVGASSGAGGGGAGGTSYGMYLNNSAATTNGVTYNAGTAGNSGSGGSSVLAPGTDGGSGSSVDVAGISYTNTASSNSPISGTCTEIITADLASNQICVGDSIWVDYNAVGDFIAANVFSAEMSDAAGSFAAPIVIGSITSMTSGTIPSYIPLATPVGAGYKFRVVSSSPASTGSETASVAINQLPTVSYTLTGSNPICLGDSVLLNGTGADTYAWDNGVVDGEYFEPSSTMDYIVTGTTASTGCSSSDTLNIQVNLPTSSTLVESSCGDYTSALGNVYTTTGMYDEIYTNAVGCDSTVTIDLTVTQIDNTVSIANGVYTSNGTGTYQWLDCGNNYQPIDGETGQSFTPTANGDYAVQITTGPCVDTSDCNAIFNVGIAEIENDFIGDVYPNPTTGKVTLTFNSTQSSIVVQVVDVTGKLLSSEVYNQADHLELNIDGESGLYFIHLLSNESDQVVRVVKQDK